MSSELDTGVDRDSGLPLEESPATGADATFELKERIHEEDQMRNDQLKMNRLESTSFTSSSSSSFLSPSFPVPLFLCDSPLFELFRFLFPSFTHEDLRRADHELSSFIRMIVDMFQLPATVLIGLTSFGIDAFYLSSGVYKEESKCQQTRTFFSVTTYWSLYFLMLHLVVFRLPNSAWWRATFLHNNRNNNNTTSEADNTNTIAASSTPSSPSASVIASRASFVVLLFDTFALFRLASAWPSKLPPTCLIHPTYDPHGMVRLVAGTIIQFHAAYVAIIMAAIAGTIYKHMDQESADNLRFRINECLTNLPSLRDVLTRVSRKLTGRPIDTPPSTSVASGALHKYADKSKCPFASFASLGAFCPHELPTPTPAAASSTENVVAASSASAIATPAASSSESDATAKPSDSSCSSGTCPFTFVLSTGAQLPKLLCNAGASLYGLVNPNDAPPSTTPPHQLQQQQPDIDSSHKASSTIPLSEDEEENVGEESTPFLPRPSILSPVPESNPSSIESSPISSPSPTSHDDAAPSSGTLSSSNEFDLILPTQHDGQEPSLTSSSDVPAAAAASSSSPLYFVSPDPHTDDSLLSSLSSSDRSIVSSVVRPTSTSPANGEEEGEEEFEIIDAE